MKSAQPSSPSSRSLRTAIEPILDHVRSPLYGSGYALFLSAASASVLGLVYWLIAARTYTVHSLGVQSALLSAMMLIAGVAQLSLSNLLVRLLPVSGPATSRLILICYGLSFATALAVAIGFVAGTELWSSSLSFLRTDHLWFVFFVLATATWCVFGLQDSVLAGMRQAKWVPLENTVASLGKILLLVVLASQLPSVGIFVSWNIPGLLAVILVNLLIFRRLAPRHERRTRWTIRPSVFGSVWRYVAGNYVGALFALASVNLVPLIVIAKTDPASTAYFFLPWSIFTALQFLSTSIATPLTVEGAMDISSLRSNSRRALIQSLGIIAPLAVGTAVLAPEILGVFGGNYSQEGAPLLRWLAIAAMPNAVVALALALARALDCSWLVAGAQAVTCAVLLGMTYPLLPKWGIDAVGFAALLSQTAAAAFIVIFVMRMLVPRPSEGRLESW